MAMLYNSCLTPIGFHVHRMLSMILCFPHQYGSKSLKLQHDIAYVFLFLPTLDCHCNNYLCGVKAQLTMQACKLSLQYTYGLFYTTSSLLVSSVELDILVILHLICGTVNCNKSSLCGIITYKSVAHLSMRIYS